MMDFTTIDVAELIPHSGKMVLLDRIIDCDDNSLSAEWVVRDDGLLGNDKTVPAWAGIEYMAQAIAAYAGMMAKRVGGLVKVGFLLGTRHYSSNVAEFKVGSMLKVRVKKKIIQDNNLAAFECEIQGAGVEVRANLNVYQPPHNDHKQADDE
jgi:predicted hotdog family 3-hydroxylacyl-ACP dehydratase